MRIVLPMVTMLIAGFALGGGLSTLFGSAQLDRGLHREAQWKALVEKQNSTISDQTILIREQSAALKRLTEATDGLLEATRHRN